MRGVALNIRNGTRLFNEVAILQKCFCDIPFHKLADSFAVNGVGDVYESLSKDEQAELEKNNTHFAYYGEYAVAFAKSWGEKSIFSRFTISTKIRNMQKIFLLYLVEFSRMMTFQKNILKMSSIV